MAKRAKTSSTALTPIPYWTLVQRIQSGDFSADDFSTYFSLTGLGFSGAGPALKINEDAVDITGVERAARASATSLGEAASEAARHRLFARTTARPHASLIVAEGDSWFNLPPIAPPTLIDVLQSFKPIKNIAMWGDTLNQILASRQYKQFLENFEVSHILISAGGNDFLEDISAHLNLFNVDYTQVSDAPYYIKGTFYSRIDAIERQYRRMLDDIVLISPRTIIVGHGYDYAIPSPGGSYLGAPMANRGLDCRFDGPLCEAIVRLMIDEWNDRLAKIDRDYSNFSYVNFRGTVGQANQWFDELHPKERAAKRLAEKMKKFIA